MAQGLDGVQERRAINRVLTGQHADEVTKARARDTNHRATTKKVPGTALSSECITARMSLPEIVEF